MAMAVSMRLRWPTGTSIGTSTAWQIASTVEVFDETEPLDLRFVGDHGKDPVGRRAAPGQHDAEPSLAPALAEQGKDVVHQEMKGRGGTEAGELSEEEERWQRRQGRCLFARSFGRPGVGLVLGGDAEPRQRALGRMRRDEHLVDVMQHPRIEAPPAETAQKIRRQVHGTQGIFAGGIERVVEKSLEIEVTEPDDAWR